MTRPVALLSFALSGLCLAASAVGAEDAVEDGTSSEAARRILQRAVEAHGGEENLAKLQTARRVVEGTFQRADGQSTTMRFEMAWKLPDQVRSVQTISLPSLNREVKIIKVLSGEEGWMRVPARDGLNAQTGTLEGDRLQTLKDEAHAIPLPNLTRYLDENHTLSLLEPAEVNGKPAEGVLIRAEEYGDIKLWFDKETGLLAKQETRTRLISNQAETLQENVYGDYRDHDGVQYWGTVESRLDGGDRALEGKLSELELSPEFAEGMFAKPE